MLLDNQMQGMQGLDPQAIQQLMQIYQQSQQDPFTRSMPGEQILGQSQPPPVMGMGQPEMDQGQQSPYGGMAPSTDFSNTPPGLPNLPDNLGGFGFGQNAPVMQGPSLKQQMIQQLLSQMQGMQGIPGIQG